MAHHRHTQQRHTQHRHAPQRHSQQRHTQHRHSQHRHRARARRSLVASGTLGFSRAVRLFVGVAAVATLIGMGVSAGTSSASHPAAETVASVVTIYPTSYRPAETVHSDDSSVELGVQFGVSTPGQIIAIRFYKTAGNSGTHSGSLWSASGKQLASGTFTDESRRGWQTLVLDRPVPVVPFTSYVASYHAPRGHYAETDSEFGGQTVGNQDIFATSGVYDYGSTSSFPASTWNDAGYGVDVEFRPSNSEPVGPTDSPTDSDSPSASASASASAPASPTVTKSETPSPTTSDSTSDSAASSPAPTRTASSTPTSSGTSSGDLPDLTDYPNASNSGLPAGTTLRAVPQDVQSGPGWHWDPRGWVVIDGDGTTFSGYKLTTGAVEVYAAGVTISDNDLQNDGNSWSVGLRPGASGTVVEDNDLHGPCLRCADRLTYGVDGDLGGDTSKSRIIGNNFYNIDHPLQQESGLIQDNYVHDLATTPAGTDHVDAFFAAGGDSGQLTLDHNTLLNDFTGDGKTASVMLNNAMGSTNNKLIENNLVAGGNFTIYGGGAVSGGSNVVIRDNEFSTAYFPQGGYYGPTAYVLPDTNGNSFSGNVWADGPLQGQPLD